MWRGSALRSHAQQVRADASILQTISSRFTIHVAHKPIEFGQLTITDRRWYANWILFAAPRRRDAAPVHTDLAHLAAIALMYATLQELGTMPARRGRIEGEDFHFVIRIATAWRIQAFPVEDIGKQLKYHTSYMEFCRGCTYMASVSALRHLSRSCSDFK